MTLPTCTSPGKHPVLAFTRTAQQAIPGFESDNPFPPEPCPWCDSGGSSPRRIRRKGRSNGCATARSSFHIGLWSSVDAPAPTPPLGRTVEARKGAHDAQKDAVPMRTDSAAASRLSPKGERSSVVLWRPHCPMWTCGVPIGRRKGRRSSTWWRTVRADRREASPEGAGRLQPGGQLLVVPLGRSVVREPQEICHLAPRLALPSHPVEQAHLHLASHLPWFSPGLSREPRSRAGTQVVEGAGLVGVAGAVEGGRQDPRQFVGLARGQ